MTIINKIIVTKKFNGYEWLKSQAQRGASPIYQQVANPYGLAREAAILRGVSMPTRPVGAAVSIFVMMRILRNNTSGYFRNASYRDAQVCWEALQKLRHQYAGPEEKEIDGLRTLFLPGVLENKNRRVLEELLIPYLQEMQALNLWDEVRALRYLLNQDMVSLRKTERRIYHLVEDPFTPLEQAVLERIYPKEEFHRCSQWELLPLSPFKEEGKNVVFEGYGSYNEWREVLDRIIKTGLSYDRFVVAAGKVARFAQYYQEHPVIPFTLGEGSERYGCVKEGIALRTEQALLAGFGEEEIPSLERAIRDSLKSLKTPGETTREGKVHLTTLGQLPLIHRPGVFLVGMEEMIHRPTEDPFLLDGDILELRKKCPQSTLKTSLEKTGESLKEFRDTLDWLREQKQSIVVSYSHYDTATLKSKAKPSILVDLEESFVNEPGGGFFEEHRLPLTREERYMVRSFWKGPRRVLPLEVIGSEGLGPVAPLRLSATEAEEMVKCPYGFAITHLMEMKLPEKEKEPGRWLDTGEKGTLCHEIFARYHQWEKGGLSLEDKERRMETFCHQVISRWKKEFPPVGNPEKEIRDIEKLAKEYVGLKHPTDNRRMVYVEHPMTDKEILEEKIWLRGKADLVEEDREKEMMVISDVKTGDSVNQVEEDSKSCLQVLFYCWLLQQEAPPVPVKEGHYLYPKQGRDIFCSYSETRREEVVGLLKEAVNALETGEGWKREEANHCMYCKAKEQCVLQQKNRYFQSLRKEGQGLDK